MAHALFKHDIDFRMIRKDTNYFQEKFRHIQNEIERLEDDYEDALLYSGTITLNLYKMAQEQ